MQTMGFRAKPAAVIDEALSEGGSICCRTARAPLRYWRTV